MARTTGAKGLRLTLPGAPLEPHVVLSGWTPVPGYFAPHIPTPVGGPGELSVAQAEGYAADPAVHLELVDITDPDAARDFWHGVRDRAKRGLSEFARDNTQGGEPARVADELAAHTDGVLRAPRAAEDGLFVGGPFGA